MELYALADGEKKKLLPGVPGMSAGAGFLEISYTEFGGSPIGMTVALYGGKRQVCASVPRMENHSAADVVEVLMPHIGGVYLGEDYADDAIIYPHHAGERTRNPVMGYGVNKKDFWRASSVAFGGHLPPRDQLLRPCVHELDVLLRRRKRPVHRQP